MSSQTHFYVIQSVLLIYSDVYQISCGNRHSMYKWLWPETNHGLFSHDQN